MLPQVEYVNISSVLPSHLLSFMRQNTIGDMCFLGSGLSISLIVIGLVLPKGPFYGALQLWYCPMIRSMELMDYFRERSSLMKLYSFSWTDGTALLKVTIYSRFNFKQADTSTTWAYLYLVGWYQCFPRSALHLILETLESSCFWNLWNLVTFFHACFLFSPLMT